MKGLGFHHTECSFVYKSDGKTIDPWRRLNKVLRNSKVAAGGKPPEARGSSPVPRIRTE